MLFKISEHFQFKKGDPFNLCKIQEVITLHMEIDIPTFKLY